MQKDGTWNWQSAINFAPNEGARTKSGSITIPNEAVKARIWVEIDAYSDYGHWWFTNLTVRKNDTISQINMSAGTTLIQNDKIYMDASSTVFSGKAFIPDAAITNISADKINTGTLDAGRINVINLNANNITTGTIKGQNSSFNLTDGTLTALNQYNEGVFMRNGKLEFTSRQSWNNNSTATYGYIQSLPKMCILGYNYGGLDINGTSGFVLHNDKTKIKTSNSGQSGSAVEGGSYIFGSDGLTSINNENAVFINAGAQ